MAADPSSHLSSRLAFVEQIAAADSHLAVCVTSRADGSPQVSVVNAGILDHPVNGSPCVALVARGDAVKVVNLRARPECTLVFRAGWQWVSVRGASELCGPDDALPGVDADGLRRLLRDVFHAAGGTHDDLEEYDRAMAAERRCVVLVRPDHIATNPG